MLKMALLDCAINENVAALTEAGHRPHPGGFDSSRVPIPGNLPSKAKKVLMPGGHQQLGAAEIDWCITVTENIMQVYTKMEESRDVHFYLKSLKEICPSLATIFRKFESPPVASAKNLVISLREFEIISLLFYFPWKTSFFVYVPMLISKGTNIGDHWFQFSHEAGIFVSYCSGVQKCIDWFIGVFYNSQISNPRQIANLDMQFIYIAYLYALYNIQTGVEL